MSSVTTRGHLLLAASQAPYIGLHAHLPEPPVIQSRKLRLTEAKGFP